MRYTLLVIGIALVLAVPAFAGGDGIHVKTLDNGLQIVVKEDHSKPLAALRIYVKTGGAFEMDFLGCGISHYYEHLLSGGTTTNRTEEESARILARLGGQSNAYTSSDHTCYHIVTHRDFIGEAIDLYGDWMMNNVLDPDEVEREKGVILKEMNMGRDEPQRVLYTLLLETVYREHSIRVPNIGYEANFRRITRDDLVRYYRNHYAPNNAVVAVAGDVDPARVFEQVEKAMGGWERRPEPVVILKEEPRQVAPRYAEVELDVQQAWANMAWHTIGLFDPDIYALDMVSAVLATGRSSRLFRRVVEEEQLTGAISTYSLTPWFMKGRFQVSFQAPMDKLDRVLAVVKEEIERLKTEGVSAEELARAKVLVESEYQMGRQTVEDQAAEVGHSLMVTGDARFNGTYLDGMRGVTAEEVAAAARRYLPPEGLTVTVLRPIGSKAASVAGPDAEEGEQAVHTVALPNGIRLVVKRVPGVGPVAVELYSLGGLRAEPAGKNGVSFLTGRLLIKGTSNRTAAQIALEVEKVGASISSQSGNNTIGLSLTLARGAKDLPFAADLVADILMNASFPEDEFDKEKQIAAMLSSRQDEDWQSEMMNFMRREMFGDSPYGRAVLGTSESIASLQRDDVVDFAKRWLRPEHLVIAVAGDVDPAGVIALLKERLSVIARPDEPVVYPQPQVPEWAEKGLGADRFVFKENQKGQAVLCFAFPGLRYLDIEDRAPMLVVDAFTSGIGLPGGWFHNALRGGTQSLVYFVHLSIFAGLEPGATWVYTQTQPSLLQEVYGIMREQVRRLKAGEFTDEELEIGRSQALVADPYYSQTVSDVASGLALSMLYGGGTDLSDRLQEALKHVTRADVMRVVDKYFPHMLVTVTGPASVRPIFEEMKAADGN